MESKNSIQNKKTNQKVLPLKEWHAPKLYDLETSETEHGASTQADDTFNSNKRVYSL